MHWFPDRQAKVRRLTPLGEWSIEVGGTAAYHIQGFSFLGKGPPGYRRTPGRNPTVSALIQKPLRSGQGP